MTEEYGKEYNLAPRYQYFNDAFQPLIEPTDAKLLSPSPESHIYFLDLEREAEIGIGVDFPTELAADECLLTADWAADGIKIGDQVAFAANYRSLWFTIASMYDYEFYPDK